MGAGVGLFLAGPPGAVGGAVAGPLVASVLRDLTHRFLSHREDARVGGAVLVGVARLQERIDAGDQVRNDGFLASMPGRRSDGEGIIEGVLLAAQRDHEERKVEFLGYLLANVCFESEVDSYLANWTIKIAQELTWAQLVMLSAVGRSDRPYLSNVEISTGVSEARFWGIHEQWADLGWARREMILPRSGKTPRSGPIRSLADYKLMTGGALLFQLMCLERIPLADVTEIFALLQVSA